MIKFFTSNSLIVLILLFSSCDPSDSSGSMSDNGTPKLSQIEVIIEIPAGSDMKYELDKNTGEIAVDMKDGKPRQISYLSYPANYGLIPGTLQPSEDGGDGDPLDVIVLGAAVERGVQLKARPVAVLELLDGGEQDDKIIAVKEGTPFENVK